MNGRLLFGEFLIARGLMSQDQVATALVEQIRGMPSLAEIAHEKNLLTSAQLLSVFAQQTQQGVDFVTACRAQSLWSDALREAMTAESDRRRRPIGEILISLGYLNPAALGKALEDYLSSAEAPVVNAPVVQSAPVMNLPPENDLVPNFCEIFSAAARADLDVLIQELAVTGSWAGADAQTGELLRRMRGAAQLAELPEIEKLCAALLDAWAAGRDPAAEGWLENAIAAINILWKARESLRSTGAAPQTAEIEDLAGRLGKA